MEPIILKPGEQVTKNGLYRIPIERYHRDPFLCDGPSVSSSGLRQVYKVPKKFWAHSIYNPERREPPRKTVFTFGKAAHAITLEGGLPRSEFAVHRFANFSSNEGQPHDKYTTFADFGLRYDPGKAPKGGVSYSTYKKAWKEKAERIGLSVLSLDDIRTIAEIYQAIQAEPQVQTGLFQGLIECCLIWKDEPTGVWIKSRPDVIPFDDTQADAKFVEDASPQAINQAITKYNWHMQFALGVEGIARVMGNMIVNNVIVAVEKTFPHVVTIAPIDDESIAFGIRENRVAIDAFARLMEENDWPGYAPGPVTVGLQAWRKKQLENNKNLLPEVQSLKEMANA